MIETYHCLCTELILATSSPLSDFPKRKRDGAFICKLPQTTILPSQPGNGTLTDSIAFDEQPVVLKLEDGFEKRILAKCGRCGVVVGYGVVADGEKERREDVVYLLQGGLMRTEEMEKGREGRVEGEVEA